jgi:hypothetical protein
VTPPGVPDLRQRKTARGVVGLHEALVRLHAYPPDGHTLEAVRKALEGFRTRRDVRRLAAELADTGIAGTAIHYEFFWATARWLVARWPEQVRVDWESYRGGDRLTDFLDALLPFTETVGLDDLVMAPEDWLEQLKNPAESDAAFLIQRVAASPTPEGWKEKLFEALNVPLVIESGATTPTRTTARWQNMPACYQTGPLDRARPDLRHAIPRPPRRVRNVSRRDGAALIDMAREAMVTRSRDLDVFINADPNDVRMVEDGDDLWFAAMGLRPEKRHVLETVQGFLILRSGVPLGYVLNTSLFGTSEVALNIFDSFRGGETGRIYGRVLAMLHHLFGSDVFVVPPYQLGHENAEGLESGAWWFYYKLGFRPVDAEVKRLVRRELARMKRRPGHRSSLDTLNELASENMYWYLDRPRSDVFGRVVLGRVGLVVSNYLGDRFGADRERGVEVCATEAAGLLGLDSLRGFRPGERLAWHRWAPLVLCLPGLDGWSREEKADLVDVIRAKGGKREVDYTRLFDWHASLRRAIVTLSA